MEPVYTISKTPITNVFYRTIGKDSFLFCFYCFLCYDYKNQIFIWFFFDIYKRGWIFNLVSKGINKNNLLNLESV